jgi:hypothetical protein
MRNRGEVMKNKDKIILDLCGGTGSWSRHYREAGYDVRLVTLPDGDVRTYIPPENVYGILAAPPCTEFSIAKGSKPRDLESALEVVKSCMNIIQSCRLKGTLKFWALENPRGLLRQFLGIPHFTFEHWEYGDMQIKPTDIWGYFNEPTRKVKNKPAELTVKFGTRINGRGWARPECPEEYNHMNLNRAAIRAITPRGWAEAFFKVNQ